MRLFGLAVGLSFVLYVALAALGAVLFVVISYALAFGSSASAQRPRLWRAMVLELAATFVLLLQTPFFPFVGGRYRGAGRGRPVLLLHGFVMTRAQWLWLGRKLAARGLGPVYGMTYFSLRSVEGSAARLARVAEKICLRERVESLDIVAHSLGGIVARYYADHGGQKRVARLVTLGSPHRGTAHSRLGLGLVPVVRDLHPGSAYLHAAFAGGALAFSLTSIWSRADAIVVPPESASVAGVGQDVVLDDLGHLGMLLSSRVVDAIVEKPAMSLFDRKLIIVGGKGGVGRTTVATALAVAAARRGKRTLLCQTKSKERLSQLLGVSPVGSELVEVKERLTAVNMTPSAALREYGTMVLRSEFVAKQVLENRLSRAFLHAVPGLEDYAMLGKVWYHTTEEERGRPRWDSAILDGPATGHLITMLSVPEAILRAVPEGPLTKPAAATRALLRDKARTSVLLVTLAEDLPTNETIELAARAKSELSLPLGALVINQLFPPRFAQGASARALARFDETTDHDAVLAPLLDRARTVARRRALNERYMARLATELPLPQVQLPLLYSENFGAASIEDLSNRLEGQLAALG